MSLLIVCLHLNFYFIFLDYTLVMTDPDAPSRKDPKWREWVHWGVINLSATGSDGEEVIQYIGSGPPKDTGYHRYCFLLFEHKDKVKSERPILVNTN